MASVSPRRTKIVATIGPSSSSPEQLDALVGAGMDAARLNLSHGTHADHEERASLVREAQKRAGRPLALNGDLQGPKIRTGRVEGTFQRLVRGRVVTLVGGGASAPTRASGATSPASAAVARVPYAASMRGSSGWRARRSRRSRR